MVKGFTVHLADAAGKPACGVTRIQTFLGKPGLTWNPRYVTCRQCERIAAQRTQEPQ